MDERPSRHERIASLAYEYWEQRGRPQGSPEVDWYRAEATLRDTHSLGEEVSSAMSLGHETTWSR